MPEMETAYLNYKQLALQYDLMRHTFTAMTAARGCFIEETSVTGIYGKDGTALGLTEYGKAGFRRRADSDSVSLLVDYAEGPPELPELTLEFTLDLAGLHIRVQARGDLDWHIAGFLRWGRDMEQDTFAVCLNRDGQDLRCALGPAASTADNALYDRKLDEALEFFGSAPVRLHYDWPGRAYRFEVSSGGCDFARGFSIRIISRVYERRFGVPFRPINKRNTFPTPPAGWMTWYAVQFDAGEQTVLDNAAWQAEHLRDFGATAVWVDWEWYHGNMSGRGEPDADSFHPDPRRYPRGLKPVADRIRQLGLIPALWIGFTNDPTENEFIRAHPEAVLVQRPAWCGQYFFDLTHPAYLEQFLPAALGHLTEWGFTALKWDCLPVTLQNLDQEHSRLYNPELSSEEALRQAVEKARTLLGPDFYMLSCSGHTARDITMAVDLFDAARIGGDIFQWESFISQCVQRVMKYYPFHNVLFYADPDNVILRSKFNTLDQAVSRLSWVSLLGLPLTLGDNLPDLPEERVNLLRRGLPAIDAHPMDLRETAHDGRIVKLNLAVERPFESWNVVDVLNLTEEPADCLLDLKKDLHLPDGDYLVYDFWADHFLGTCRTALPLQLEPCATKVLAVRRRLDRPQILSTSRHVTQGAVDLEQLDWDDDLRVLTAVCRVIRNDPYCVTLHVPAGQRPFYESNATSVPEIRQVAAEIWRFTIRPIETGLITWSVAFTMLN